MRVVVSWLAVVGAAVLAAGAEAGLKPGAVTQSTIGNVRLGLTASEYAARLHERPFVTSYAGGSTRLLFSGAEVTIFMDRAGRGMRITTAAPEYRLGKGLGPCGSLSSLAHAKHLAPVAVPGPLGALAVVYRVGDLWFTLSDAKHIGSVTLSARRPSLKNLVAAAQCGIGDEHGE